jgi:polysaccharide biosynthesis protein PslG
MHGGARHPLAVVLLALCALGVLAPAGAGRGARAIHASAATPLSGVNIGGLSYNSRAAEADQLIADALEVNAKVVRIELPWAVLEPRAANEIDPKALAYTDRLMADASAAGIAVIATVDNTPCWASAAPAALRSRCSPSALHAANAWPPRDSADYAAVVAYIARRYGKSLAAIEVWNEPDQSNEHYFAGPHKPQRYAKILRAAYPAVKQAAPSVSVLGGSLVGSNGAFLRALYRAGIKGFYDGLAVHFYNLTLGSVRSIRQVQLANGDEKPLWLDEFGWTSCWPRERIQQEQACVAPGIQGLNIANIFRLLARTSYLAAEVIYQLHDEPREDFGVFSSHGGHKPAFRSLRSVLTSPFGRVSPVTLQLHRKRGRVIAAGSGPVGDFMQLEAFKGNVLRYRVLFTLDRFNRFSLRLPRVLGTHGLRVRVFQYWAGSGKAAQKSI